MPNERGEEDMSNSVTCFFAYPINPPALAETIESTIALICGNSAVKAQSWRSFSAAGKFITHEVCSAINACTLFACDLTRLSQNVLFELGYAIARNKRIWITLDASYEHAKANYKSLGLLNTVGYTAYENSLELATKFSQEQPYTDLSMTLCRRALQAAGPVLSQHALFYLKSEVRTEASLQLTHRLAQSALSVIADDWQGMSQQPLEWYIKNIYGAHAVVAHLLGDDRENRFRHNAKAALVAGLASGFEKPLLLLAQAPYIAPVDYRDVVKVHRTASECLQTVNTWLPEMEAWHQYRQSQTGPHLKVTRPTSTIGRVLGKFAGSN
jgi:hypothetical protein